LAYAKLKKVDWQAMFDDRLDNHDNPIEDDLAKLGHMPLGSSCQQWRADRRIAKIRVLNDGYYVDICHTDTINALRDHAGDWLSDVALVEDPSDLDISVLTSNRRSVTSAAAHWISHQVLEDGSEPRGIKYPSRHGVDQNCWAIWVPLLGEQEQARVSELVRAHARVEEVGEISLHDADLKDAANYLGLRCFLVH
jgi:hypothetical protein